MDEHRLASMEKRMQWVEDKLDDMSELKPLLERLDERSKATGDSVRAIHNRFDFMETDRKESEKETLDRINEIELLHAEERPMKSAAKFVGAGVIGSLITGCGAWLAGKWP